MNFPVLKGAAYALFQANDMVIHQGTTQTSERIVNPDSDHLKNLPKHLRSFEDAVAYGPNQAYIGNIHPKELNNIPRPWYENPMPNAQRVGKYGEILPEDEAREERLRRQEARQQEAKAERRPGKEEAWMTSIQEALEKYHGNRTLAAKELGISTTTLWRWMKRYQMNEN